MMRRKESLTMKPTVFVLASLAALSASATWTLSTEDVPSGCSHVITDGNWKIGVYRYSDDNWNLCKSTGNNGPAWVAGEGVLDLRNVTAEVISKPHRACSLEVVAA